MATIIHTPARLRGTSVCAVINLCVAALWGLAGVLGFFMSFLAVHVSPIPLLLLGATGSLWFSAILLLDIPTDGRPSNRALLYLGLAIACAWSYWLFMLFDAGRGWSDVWHFDPGTVGLLHIPALTALCLLAEVVYLWRRRSSGSTV